MPGSGPSTRLAAALAIAVVLAVIVAGGAWAVDPPSPDPVGADAGERYAAVDGVSATKTMVVERGNDTSRTVADVQFRPGSDHRRVTVTESANRRYEETVSNGSVLWLYDRDAAVVERVPLSGDAAARPSRGERVERLFARLNVTTADTAASRVVRGVSPLPVVPAAGRSGAGGPPGTADRALELRYDGTESVDGREAHVLRLASGDGAVKQRLWVDAEHFLVLKHRTAWTANGERVAVTTTYANVSVDPGLGDAAFSFDPPANATVEAVETPETTAYRSVQALRENTSIRVPDPSLPASFSLTYASETTGRIRGVGLRYVNETARVTVAKYNRTVPTDGDRRVTVAGRDAEVSVGATTSVSWNCGTHRYTVRGQGVPVDALVAIARSVACR